MSRGDFITFEGGEGAGKSTQIKRFSEYLNIEDEKPITTREPGGTPGAEAIRQLLVTGGADSWDAISETLLFFAARNDHIARRIKPALAEGKTVLCDRFTDSTLVYQGIGKKLGLIYIQELHRLVFGNFTPDLTFILDIDPQEGLKRAHSRNDSENRFEALDISFHQAIREGFLSLANANPECYRIIDASASPDAVHQAIIESYREWRIDRGGRK